jgi:large subunit ribosomal protein L9
MKVILKKDVNSIGKSGDTVRVSDGYARNFLIPKGLAVEASEENIKNIALEKSITAKRAEKTKHNAELLLEKLCDMKFTLSGRVGEQGKLFGSITSKDIEKVLKDQGIKVDKKNILIEEPIKTPGEFPVKIKLYQGIVANIKITVIGKL